MPPNAVRYNQNLMNTVDGLEGIHQALKEYCPYGADDHDEPERFMAFLESIEKQVGGSRRRNSRGRFRRSTRNSRDRFRRTNKNRK